MIQILFTAAVLAAAATIQVTAVPTSAPSHNPAHNIEIITGSSAGPVERNAARLFEDRLKEQVLINVSIRSETEINTGKPATPGTVRILLGRPEHHTAVANALTKRHIPALTLLAPGPEGFLLNRAGGSATSDLVAAGVDDRGVVYAVGELLRRFVYKQGAFLVPTEMNIRTAPAFEVRGTQIGQSGVMLDKAKARKWTEADREHAIADIVLAGANTIQVGSGPQNINDPVLRFLASLGVKTLCHYTPNEGSGPVEWRASESIGREGYLCPSVPEAHAELLRKCEAEFQNSPDFDYVRLVGGDGGGCECDRCKPFGGVFIRLCEEEATIIHRYHPHAQIFITNQKFDNASDEAIFKYLQEAPRPWLRAFCYGPGSDAMSWQPGHRQTHRMDLFQYPGFGPPSRYLHEILHQLPPEQDLVFYNEITHWRYSEFGYIQAYPRADKEGNQPPHWGHDIYERMPDRYLTLVYDRLSFFAWPRFYHRMFGETVRYGIGDCTHSSGTQDHFNQWMWQRLMWNPHQSVEAVVDEYAQAWFGPEAAKPMARALFQLEQNIQDDPETPLPVRPGIKTYYHLVREAGELMGANARNKNWLWMEYMQKAAIDLHTALEVGVQLSVQDQVRKCIQTGLKSTPANLNVSIGAATGIISNFRPTPEMQRLRAEAIQLGEQSNSLHGVRSEGIYSLDHDFIGLGWIKRQLSRAATAAGSQKHELLQLVANYQDPGPGGFYDNCGTYEKMPHLVHGYPYDFGQPLVSGMISELCTHSQRTMCSTQDEKEGVAFRYEGLDPHAHYTVRVTLVRPQYQGRYAIRMHQHSESIYANDYPLVHGQEVPAGEPEMFSYDVPIEETKGGEVTIRFEKMPDVANGDRVSVEQWRNTGGWGTIVSEIWLIKKPSH